MHPVRPPALQLFIPVAAGEEAHGQRAGAARGQEVPHAVPHDDGVADLDAQPLGGGEEQVGIGLGVLHLIAPSPDRKSTRLNSSHGYISYAVFCLKKKKTQTTYTRNS